jgi:hypothetical protein
MGVEPFEAAVDHVLDQAALAVGIEGTNVFVLDFFQDLDHEADQGIITVLLAGGGAVRNGVAKKKDTCDTQEPGEVPAWHNVKILL